MNSQLEAPSNFLPGRQGTASAREIHIASDDPLRPQAVLAVVGRAAGRRLRAPPEMLDLGDVASPASATLTFTSDGADPVTVKELSLNSGANVSIASAPAGGPCAR